MLNLRLGTQSDVDTIVNFASLLISENLPFVKFSDTIRVSEIVNKVLMGNKNENVIIIISHNQTPIGVLGAAVSRPLFCREDETLAVELLLYLEPEHRNRAALRALLQAYRFWAKRVGCTYISYATYKNGIEMSRTKRLN